MSESQGAEHGRAGALAAMRDASQDPDLASEYATISAAFTAEDYQTIVDIAWRHQFSDDRSVFKRDLRELQQDVSRRAIERLGQGE